MLKHFDRDALFYILVPVFDWLLLSWICYSFRNAVLSAAIKFNFNIPFKFYLKCVGILMAIYLVVWFVCHNENSPHGMLSHMYKLAFMTVLPGLTGLYLGITKVLSLNEQEKQVLIKEKANKNK